MEALPTLKLSLSELDGNQCFCRTDDEGSTSASHLASLPWGDATGWLESFLAKWRVNETFEVLTNSDLRAFGQALFEALFSQDMKQRLAVLRGPSLDDARLAISLEGARLYALPMELLHDGSNFLEASGVRIVRIMNRRLPTQAGFRPLDRMLVVLAKPESEAPWNRDEHMRNLREQLKTFEGLTVDVLDPPTPDNLTVVLQSAASRKIPFDALYVVAHGLAESGEEDGTFLLEDGAQSSSVTGSGLARLLRDHPGCFVFLNSCSSASLSNANMFSGVAQRLMTDGRAGAVWAMQRPVRMDYALKLAVSFFRNITSGQLAEDAAFAAKAPISNRNDAAVPCFYSQLAGPEQEETARLASFLNAQPESASLEIYLARFRMGLPKKDFLAQAAVAAANQSPYPDLPKNQYRYAGETIAKDDLGAAWGFIELFHRAIPQNRVEGAVALLDADNMGDDIKASHLLLIGSRSQSRLSSFLHEKSNDFEFKYSDEIWTITDKRNYKIYRVNAPHLASAASGTSSVSPQVEDYALIEKIIDGPCTIFIVAGMRDTSTLAAGRFLCRGWRDLQKRYGRKEFQVLLQLNPAAGEFGVKVIDRARADVPPAVEAQTAN